MTQLLIHEFSSLNGARHLFIRLSSKFSLAVRLAGVSNQKAIDTAEVQSMFTMQLVVLLHISLTVMYPCAVHPFGVDDYSCLDFRQDPNAEPEELWEPVGVIYIDSELVIERSYYNGEEIPSPQLRLTREEQWEILNTHPLFTRHCPKCRYQFPPHVPELIHFDCPICGWIDDSV